MNSIHPYMTYSNDSAEMISLSKHIDKVFMKYPNLRSRVNAVNTATGDLVLYEKGNQAEVFLYRYCEWDTVDINDIKDNLISIDCVETALRSFMVRFVVRVEFGESFYMTHVDVLKGMVCDRTFRNELFAMITREAKSKVFEMVTSDMTVTINNF